MKYPFVCSEFQTVAELRRGKSIARFGDGELKLVDGAGYVREPANPKLGAELQQVLTHPSRNCIVGIPTMAMMGPKFEGWVRHKERFEKVLSPNIQYYSAFISRPDSAPWIRRPEFAVLMQSLWLGRRVAVVCEEKGSALRAAKIGAHTVEHIECPSYMAYSVIDGLEKAVVDCAPDIALLSAGPTASCLANRLAARGIQAIDIGSGGKFICELLQ